MASQAQHRTNLKLAISKSATQRRLQLSDSTVNYFVERAISHIYLRYSAEINRDHEVAEAVTLAPRLVKNLEPLLESQTLQQINLSQAEDYVRNDSGCFYPFCKPKP